MNVITTLVNSSQSPTSSSFVVRCISWQSFPLPSRVSLDLARIKLEFHPNSLSLSGSAKSSPFAYLLPQNHTAVIFFGLGPYVLFPGMDVSNSLTYTSLLLNPFTTALAYVEGKPSTEYFINVTSIKMNGLTLPLNSFTKMSTVNPYTVLESSIFNTLSWAFLKVLPASIPRLGYIEPYEQCFNSSYIGENDVLSIDLVLQSESVYWRLSRPNSMVQVKKDVVCLAFVDAGQSPIPRTSIVIGEHQLEENLLQFDLVNKKFGFSSALLSQKTSCSNFNFTSTA
ncbi:basic 7S globulin 2 precursor small subunit [Pyrus ussuriensis x Pyrus communis]|uniref:Basic 7S globulin 2 small subunit n=1 Tax=Pyrus ussuriensis x Pyrus communis TaxID=2448454 RepID=A0A5N5F925_9ROSA|nr:basic 7S globulin 2 precursor small subunit [Pyrus ussuriensis x Pyrus communis]